MHDSLFIDRQPAEEQMGMGGMGMGQMGMMGGGGPGQMGMGGMGMGQMGGMGISGSDYALVNDISQAIILEVQAYNYYQRLIGLAADQQDRQLIYSIQRDEAKHYHWFTMMLRMMGAPLPQISAGDYPASFGSGVRTAIRRELEAQAFYQDIAYRAASHMIQMHFMHASMDEQRHASWLQSML